MRAYPKHIAFILDGNGRWAIKKKKTRGYGHQKGVERIEDILQYCQQLKIPIVTIYAFSSENWKRSKAEKKILFNLLINFFKLKINKIIEKETKIKIIGDTDRFSKEIKNLITKTENYSKNFDKYLLQIALSYGGRNEIIRGVKKCLHDHQEKKIPLEDVNEDSFKKYLDTGIIKDPDLLIRTGGDIRISNFLLYQLAYTELYFTKVFWPDFTRKDLDKAINQFQCRERRFGA